MKNNVLKKDTEWVLWNEQNTPILNKYFPLVIGLFKVFGLFSILLIPFAVDDSLPNPTQDGHLFHLLLIGYILVGVMGVQIVYLSKKYTPKVTIIDLLLLFTFIYISFHTNFLFESYPPLKYWAIFSLYIVYLFFRVNLTEANIFYVMFAVVILGLAQTTYGCLQLYGFTRSYHSMFKITGSFFNPGPFAGYLSSIFPVVFGLYLFPHKFSFNNSLVTKGLSILMSSTLLLMLFIIPILESRASWLSISFSSLYVLCYRYNIKSILSIYLNTKRKMGLFFTAAALLVGLLGWGLYKYKQGSSDGRLLIWEVTIDMISDAPVFGYGLEQFKANYMGYQGEYFQVNEGVATESIADNTMYAFNEFLLVTTETGIVGLLIMLLILFSLLFSGNSKENEIVYIVRSGIIGVLVFSIFSYPSEIFPILLNVTLYCSLLAFYQTGFSIRERFPKVLNRSALAISGLIFTLLTIPGYSIYALNKTGFELWEKAKFSYQLGSYQSATNDYREAYPAMKNNGLFLLNYSKALELNEQYIESIRMLKNSEEHLSSVDIYLSMGNSYQSIGKYADAEACYLKAHYMVPVRFYPLYLLAKLYKQMGDNARAVEIAQEILNKEIKVDSMAIQQIQVEMKKFINELK